MSLIEDLKKEINTCEKHLNEMGDVHYPRILLVDKILSGKYGTEIMLDYLDYLGGDSVEFVRKQQDKGIQRKD